MVRKQEVPVDASEIPVPTTGWMYKIRTVNNGISTTFPSTGDRRISGCHQLYHLPGNSADLLGMVSSHDPKSKTVNVTSDVWR